MKINVLIVILIDLHWYALILWIIIIFPLSQIHWIDHIAVIADSNYNVTVMLQGTIMLAEVSIDMKGKEKTGLSLIC